MALSSAAIAAEQFHDAPTEPGGALTGSRPAGVLRMSRNHYKRINYTHRPDSGAGKAIPAILILAAFVAAFLWGAS